MEPNTKPSTSDPQITALVFSLLRWIFAILSGAGIIAATKIDDSTLMLFASAAVGIASAIWGLYDKFQAKRRDHENSVASARAMLPVEVLK